MRLQLIGVFPYGTVMKLMKQNGEMNSFEFMNQVINPARIEEGESKVRHVDFLAKVKDELGCEGVYETFVHPQNGKEYQRAVLDSDQMILIGMRESKKVRRNILIRMKLLALSQASNPFTQEALKLKAFVDVGLLTKEEAIKAAGIKTTQEPRLQPPTYDRQAIKRDIIRYIEQNQGATRTHMERERRAITMHPHTRDLFREIVKELI